MPTCATCSSAKATTQMPPTRWDCSATRRKKFIGAYAAALGGLDTLVFAGGIGENSPLIRERICAGLGFLGLHLDGRRNAKNAPLISRGTARVEVRVIRTDEEVMIARSVIRVLARRTRGDRTAPGKALSPRASSATS